MRRSGPAVLVLGLVVAAAGADRAPPRPITRGRETTHVTLLDQNGELDYESALNRRLGQGVTPRSNASVLVWKAIGPHPEGARMPPAFFRWLGVAAPPEEGDYFIDLGQYATDVLKLPPGAKFDELIDQYGRATRRPWKAKQYPRLAGWLEANEKPLAIVIEAAKRPDYFHPLVAHRTAKGPGGLISATLPNVQKCRWMVGALVARAMLHAAEGRFDRAWPDLLASHRLGRLVARGGTLIEALVGIAIDQIACGAELAFLDRAGLTAKQARACLRDLQGLPPMPAVADKVDLTERFMFLDTMMLLRRRGLGNLDDLGFRPAPAALAPKEQEAVEAAIDWDSVLRTGNQWYDRLAGALRVKDRAARERQLDQIDKDLKALSQAANRPAAAGGASPADKARNMGDVMVVLFVPATRKVQQAADRAEQAQRNLHLAFALAAYRADHGRYPPTLDGLAPGYLPAVPGDLFSGKALIYRPSANGYLLYSVGVNGKDDGGRWYDDDPPGDDLRIRMPLPPLKGK
jgi:hypothetical protein